MRRTDESRIDGARRTALVTLVLVPSMRRALVQDALLEYVAHWEWPGGRQQHPASSSGKRIRRVQCDPIATVWR